MKSEKRRYFRIDETVGLHYDLLDKTAEDSSERPDVLSLMSEQDDKIERLLLDVADSHPKVAELVRALNQKLERIVTQLSVDRNLVDRIALRMHEVNISACGIGFVNSDAVELGARLALEIELLPGAQTLKTKGQVVACEAVDAGFYWRIEFYDLTQATQEQLIQHIVQRQSAQLKTLRAPK